MNPTDEAVGFITENIMSLNASSQDLEKSIEKCLAELSEVQEGFYDGDKAERTAGLFLEVQLKLCNYICQVELESKLAKNEVERISAERYFFHKSELEKRSETALKEYVNNDDLVIKAKNDASKSESELKKWNNFLTILKEGHIYFRNIGKKERY